MLEFEYHGYFETLQDRVTGKIAGTRNVEPEPGRKMGQAGAREVTLTGVVELQRGHKNIALKCGSGKRFLSIVCPICGCVKDRP